MKQLFSHSVIQSLIYSMVPLLIFFAGCRTIPPQTEVRTQSRTEEVRVNDLLFSGGSRSRDSLSVRREKQEDEDAATLTVAVRYDTSGAVDPVSGNYPVAERVVSYTAKVRKIRAAENREEQAVDVRSAVWKDNSRADVRREEEALEKQKAGEDPYRWRYILGISLTVFITAAGLVCLWKKRFS